jgi:hypothetical protein
VSCGHPIDGSGEWRPVTKSQATTHIILLNPKLVVEKVAKKVGKEMLVVDDALFYDALWMGRREGLTALGIPACSTCVMPCAISYRYF